MVFKKLFGGRSPQDVEKKADDLFAAGEYGRAKMEYESALKKWRRAGRADEGFEGRVAEKIRRSAETLAQRHKEEGLEILDSEYYEAAEDAFRLALELTRDPDLTAELKGLLDRIAHRPVEEEDRPSYEPAPLLEEDPEEAPPEADDDETFAALCSTLPGPIRKAFYGYGTAFRDGYLALNEGRFDLAAEHLTLALEEKPEGEYIAFELATAHLNLGRYEEAGSLAERFLRAHPDAEQAYQLLCEILWAQEKFDQALERLDSAPAVLAPSPPLLLLRGQTLLGAGRHQQAERLFGEALKALGWHPDVARSLALSCEAQGKKEEARDLYGKLLAECRTCGSRPEPFAKQRFADLSLELGEHTTQVLEIYLSLVQEDPLRRADYYGKISRIYAARGEDAEARRFEGFARQARGESGGA